MKKLIFLLGMFLLGASAGNLYAMGKKPNCDAQYGTWMNPNNKYQFAPNAAANAWNPDGSFNYRLDSTGQKILNPVGTRTFSADGRTQLCNGAPITDYGVVCYDPTKVSYNEPAWRKCNGIK